MKQNYTSNGWKQIGEQTVEHSENDVYKLSTAKKMLAKLHFKEETRNEGHHKDYLKCGYRISISALGTTDCLYMCSQSQHGGT